MPDRARSRELTIIRQITVSFRLNDAERLQLLPSSQTSALGGDDFRKLAGRALAGPWKGWSLVLAT